MTNIKIAHEDSAEADRLEAQAIQTDDPEEAAGQKALVIKLPTPSNFPVLDQPRTEENEDLGRRVADEFGGITPYLPPDDGWTAMPLRLMYDAGGGVHVAAGPYTLGRRELRVLKTAIDNSLRPENEARRLAERTGSGRPGLREPVRVGLPRAGRQP